MAHTSRRKLSGHYPAIRAAFAIGGLIALAGSFGRAENLPFEIVTTARAASPADAPIHAPFICPSWESVGLPIKAPAHRGSASKWAHIQGSLSYKHYVESDAAIGPGAHCPVLAIARDKVTVISGVLTRDDGSFDLNLPPGDYFFAPTSSQDFTARSTFNNLQATAVKVRAGPNRVEIHATQLGPLARPCAPIPPLVTLNVHGDAGVITPDTRDTQAMLQANPDKGVLAGGVRVSGTVGPGSFSGHLGVNCRVFVLGPENKEVTTTLTDENGDFAVLLLPGDYLVKTEGRQGFEQLPVKIRVLRNQVARVELGIYIFAKCLPGDALISTPQGDVPIKELQRDSPVLIEMDGNQSIGYVLELRRTEVPLPHAMIHIALQDGRQLRASPEHPLADGRRMGDLHRGELVDGSPIEAMEVIASYEPFTYDILVSGNSPYWANGVPLQSTLVCGSHCPEPTQPPTAVLRTDFALAGTPLSTRVCFIEAEKEGPPQSTRDWGGPGGLVISATTKGGRR